MRPAHHVAHVRLGLPVAAPRHAVSPPCGLEETASEKITTRRADSEAAAADSEVAFSPRRMQGQMIGPDSTRKRAGRSS